jgi:3-phenylpropionate/trans-cinnamate dioxygenase ferredoxin subunit
MKDWHELGSLADLERDGRLITRVGGREIGVVRGPDGWPYALRNRCPHHGGPLCRGTVEERLTGSPGGYELTGERILRCPWHGWEFDLVTGSCLDDETMRAAVYPVRVEGDRVLVQA